PMATVPGGRMLVRTEDGEEFRVVEVDQALQGVPVLYTPPPRSRVLAPAAPAPSRVPAGSETAAATVPAPARLEDPPPEPAPAAPVRAAEPAAAPHAPVLLGPESVRPLGARRATPAPAPPPSAAPAAAPATRALVVDDSLVAR